MRLAIINLTGGGLSGGGLKTMSSLVPLLIKHPYVKEAQVFIPEEISQLGLFSHQNYHIWPKTDIFTCYSSLKKDIKNFAPDVVYIPNATWINFGTIPTVVMVRNMEALIQPFKDHQISLMIKNLLRRTWAKKACLKATKVIAVSQFAYEYLIREWNISSRKIDVIYHGVEPTIPTESMLAPNTIHSHGKQPFFFSAGSLISYRGLEDIISAMALLKENPFPYKIFIAGTSLGNRFGYEKKIRDMIELNGLTQSIEWLGYISAAEMAWCFHNCEAFIMTSRLEACPNLVLEALSHGCINLSTFNPPMPELFGDGAFYYNANQPEELKHLMLRVVELSFAEKEQIKAKARSIAERFSWVLAAEQTFKCLENAAAYDAVVDAAL
jgi:glycosyltransferase involved in cell wall biosynthesis